MRLTNLNQSLRCNTVLATTARKSLKLCSSQSFFARILECDLKFCLIPEEEGEGLGRSTISACTSKSCIRFRQVELHLNMQTSPA